MDRRLRKNETFVANRDVGVRRIVRTVDLKDYISKWIAIELVIITRSVVHTIRISRNTICQAKR